MAAVWPLLPLLLPPTPAGALAAASPAGRYLALLCGWSLTLFCAASCWTFFAARRLPPGPRRAAACLPVALALLAAAPLLVDRRRVPVLVVPVTGMLSLAAFKVAAYGFGRGPLALPWRLVQFGAVLSLPVVPRAALKAAGSGSGRPAGAAPASPPTTLAAFARSYGLQAGGAAAAATLAVWHALPQLARHWFYALCLSLSVGAIWDFWCFVAAAAFALDVAPSFDRPWLSSSFADYWGRRWNLTTTFMLRVLVYEPVMEGRLVPKAAAREPGEKAPAAAPAGPEEPPESRPPVGPEGAAPRTGRRPPQTLRRFLALQATFLFSGLWHTLIFFYATGLVTPHWLLFFTVQAPIVAAEAAAARAASRRGLRVPRPLAVLITNFLLIVVARPLFFGPCDWSGLCDGMMSNVTAGAAALLRR